LKEGRALGERKELLSMLRVIWRNDNSSLRRIYSSWEELESNFEVVTRHEEQRQHYVHRSCPSCGVTIKVVKPLDELFPYEKCQSCKRPYHINKDLTIRKLMEEEKENLPEDWIRILEDLNKKKLAILFKIE
jgi:hypothetical protein